MSGDQQRRIIVQSHALRTRAAEKATWHAGGEPRSGAPFLKLLIVAAILAVAIVAGLMAADMIIDMLAARKR